MVAGFDAKIPIVAASEPAVDRLQVASAQRKRSGAMNSGHKGAKLGAGDQVGSHPTWSSGAVSVSGAHDLRERYTSGQGTRPFDAAHKKPLARRLC